MRLDADDEEAETDTTGKPTTGQAEAPPTAQEPEGLAEHEAGSFE
jgi:hypothetical protein